MSDKLLPCPFCGGEPEFQESNPYDQSDDVAFTVFCRVCGTEHPWRDTPEDAVNFWNRRTSAFQTKVSLGEDGEQFVKDAIRSGYDQGYNDARLPLNLPRDSAPGYRAIDKSEEIAVNVLARLRRLPAPALREAQPHPADEGSET